MKFVRKLSVLLTAAAAAATTACGGGSDGGLVPPAANDPCSVAGQKQFVLDNMQFWYFWNDRLPATVDLDGFATPEELLAFLTSFSPNDGSGQPVDRFSFITTVEEDQQFFEEGRFEGFGINSRFEAADNLRIARVFELSPAFDAGLRRGQRILALDGRTIAQIEAAEGVGAVLDNNATLAFRMQRQDGSEFDAIVTKGIVTIDPVPQWRVIPRSGRPGVGYLELATFISTAAPDLDAAFADFQREGVTELIVDLRYNGGGLVRIAELLADYIDGAGANGEVFSSTLFNADRAAANNSEELFEQIANSLNVDDLVVIATRGTASASELVANGLVTDARVAIVGDRTFGKPVGQIGLDFCEKLLRPTAFQTVNSAGFGDFFDGLPVTCAAADDLSVAVGADTDPNVVAALAFLDTGACPVSSLPLDAAKPAPRFEAPRPDLTGPPWREFTDAY